MNKFYFVRQPDHMIECSETLPDCCDIDVIKQKHKIFSTREEAEEYQKIVGLHDKLTDEYLIKQFICDDLSEVYGYKKVK